MSKKLPKELYEHLVYCRKYENEIFVGTKTGTRTRTPIGELGVENWVGVVLQMFEEGFIPTREKEIKHLYYSKKQDEAQGCKQGRLMDGSFVKYTQETESESESGGAGWDDQVYLGKGEYISTLSKGKSTHKGHSIDSGKILT